VIIVLLVGRQDYVHDGYDRTNEKLDSHITENSTSLSAFGSIFLKKNFWREPMSVNVRVILLVGYDKTLYVPCRVWNSLGLSGLQRVWTTWLSYPFIKQ
jgi:hypothetical protein